MDETQRGSDRPISVTGTVRTRTSPSVVFAYLTDPRNQVHWTPNFLALLDGPDRPPGLGMRYRGRLKAFGPVNFVVDQHEPGRAFRVATDPAVGRLTHRFDVLPDRAGCQVAHEVQLWPRPLVRPAAPVLKLLINRMVRDLNHRMRTVLDAL